MPYLSFLVSFVLKMSNLLCVDAELVYPLSWVHTEKIFPAQLMQGGLRLAQYWILLRMALSQSRPSHGEKITGAHKHKQHSSAKSHFMTAAS